MSFRRTTFLLGSAVALAASAAAAQTMRLDQILGRLPTTGAITCSQLGADTLQIPRGTYLPRRTGGWEIGCAQVEFISVRAVTYDVAIRKLGDGQVASPLANLQPMPHVVVSENFKLRAGVISGSVEIVGLPQLRSVNGAAGANNEVRGANGGNGAHGGHGRNSRCRISGLKIQNWSATPGGHGQSGGGGKQGRDGAAGAHGQHGTPAPRIDVIVRDLDPSADIQITTLGQNGGTGGVGGRGENGGHGGAGGNGGKGGGASSCHGARHGGNGGHGGPGGKGGNGGAGGNGGNGGNGGDVTVQTSAAAAGRIKINNGGGLGGRGGAGGQPGAGGHGGPFGAAGCGGGGRRTIFENHRPGNCGAHGRNGSNGAAGQTGARGVDGRPGDPGQRGVPKIETYVPAVLNNKLGKV